MDTSPIQTAAAQARCSTPLLPLQDAPVVSILSKT